jgi:hypothetical protein
LRQIGHAGACLPSLWLQIACFLIPFVIGGLSEPPTAVMITVLGLAILAAWWWADVRSRRYILILLCWALVGAFAALLVMALAPANSIRMQTPPPPLPELILRIILYPSYFVRDTLRTLPVPTLVSVIVPALLFYVQYTQSSAQLSRSTRNRLGILMVIVAILGYLLIAASFAPSAYGQSYPAPRARFAGRVLMTAALMMEGAMLGALIGQIPAFRPVFARTLALAALAVLALYPLRTAQRLTQEIPVYRQRAAAWDAREAEIRALQSDGAQDLVIRFLRTERSQDLGDHADFRLNRCAAALYGVNSIVAVPMDK